MRWKGMRAACALALCMGLSCGGEFSNNGEVPVDTGAADALLADGVGVDGPLPGVIELVSGGITSLGGVTATETKLEKKPDFEITDDGFEYAGVHGDQCTKDGALCITEGGFAP